jgi:hypothetical protein
MSVTMSRRRIQACVLALFAGATTANGVGGIERASDKRMQPENLVNFRADARTLARWMSSL